MMTFRECTFSLVLALVGCVSGPTPAGQPTPQHVEPSDALSFSVIGSVDPAKEEWNPLRYVQTKETRRLFIELARAPLTTDEAKKLLVGGTTSLEDLLRLQILRTVAGRVHLNFSLLTQQDRDVVSKVAERYAPSLTAALADAAIYEPLGHYPIATVEKEALAFIIVGCFALDWAGLRILADGHHILLDPERPGGNHYTLIGEQRLTADSLRGVYWGSHHQASADLVLLSFGDHEVRRRSALPDLLWRLQARDGRFAAEITESLNAVHDDALFDMQGNIARVLRALRGGARDQAAVAAQTGLEAERVARLISLLADLKYVRLAEDHFDLVVPVLLADDAAMVAEVVARVSAALHSWLAASIEALRVDLGAITPVRHGVDFREILAHVWHYIFGYTNRELANSGYILDTYGSAASWPGFLGAAFDPELYPEGSQ